MKTFAELLAETIEAECRNCAGSGGPYCCTVCGGRGRVTINRYELLTDAERVTVLEAEVLRLQGLLADRYEMPPRGANKMNA